MAKKRQPKGPARVYTLEVKLLSGLVFEEFVKENPVVSRTIEIRGDQTLDDLHGCIYSAFDREEEHLFEFQFGKEPHHRKNRSYVTPESLKGIFGFDTPVAGIVTKTRMDDLALAVKTKFFYWFDFGDDWWHELRVKAISEPQPTEGKYPRVVARIGQSPPQYPYAEDEEGVEDEE